MCRVPLVLIVVGLAAATSPCQPADVVRCAANATIPECRPFEIPLPNPRDPCCPTCRFRQCTDEQRRGCAILPIRDCRANEEPTQDLITCCPSCRVREDRGGCILPPALIPSCLPGQTPIYEPITRCYTCNSANGRPGSPHCELGHLINCTLNWASLPTCAVGALPQRTSDCCFTCRLDTLCSADQIEECTQEYNNLPECAEDELPAFNLTTCCASCRRSLPRLPPVNGWCSIEAMKECVENAPTCRESEVPQFQPDFCCPTCIRPQTRCDQESVALCLANTPACVAGQTPWVLEGECCPSCLPAPPTCTPTCADSELCVPRGNATQCVSRAAIRYRIIRRTRALVTRLTQAHWRFIVREFIARFCERNSEQTRCNVSVAELGSIQVTIAADGNTQVEVDVLIPHSASPGLRRLLADAMQSSELAQDGLADPAATEGYTVEKPSSTASIAVAIVASCFGALILGAIGYYFWKKRGKKSPEGVPLLE